MRRERKRREGGRGRGRGRERGGASAAAAAAAGVGESGGGVLNGTQAFQKDQQRENYLYWRRLALKREGKVRNDEDEEYARIAATEAADVGVDVDVDVDIDGVAVYEVERPEEGAADDDGGGGGGTYGVFPNLGDRCASPLSCSRSVSVCVCLCVYVFASFSLSHTPLCSLPFPFLFYAGAAGKRYRRALISTVRGERCASRRVLPSSSSGGASPSTRGILFTRAVRRRVRSACPHRCVSLPHPPPPPLSLCLSCSCSIITHFIPLNSMMCQVLLGSEWLREMGATSVDASVDLLRRWIGGEKMQASVVPQSSDR